MRDAIEKCINEYYPGTEIKIQHAEGLADCKKFLTLAKAGRLDGYMIEGMGCFGGCVAGVGTIIAPESAKSVVDKNAKKSKKEIPEKDYEELVTKLLKLD